MNFPSQPTQRLTLTPTDKPSQDIPIMRVDEAEFNAFWDGFDDPNYNEEGPYYADDLFPHDCMACNEYQLHQVAEFCPLHAGEQV